MARIIYPQGILDKFDFLIDGRAKKQIEVFIKKKPKFEEICKELEVKNCEDSSNSLLQIVVKVYNKYVEKTQEISSLEYFTFVRLDCEKLRKVANPPMIGTLRLESGRVLVTSVESCPTPYSRMLWTLTGERIRRYALLLR